MVDWLVSETVREKRVDGLLGWFVRLSGKREWMGCLVGL